jgi:chorismate synthase
MENNTELLRNLLAAMVSAGTIIFFLLRFFKRERIEQANHISQIIKLTADNVFNGAKLETRVTALEKQERENSEYMRTSFNKVHERLDQIFTIIANKND